MTTSTIRSDDERVSCFVLQLKRNDALGNVIFLAQSKPPPAPANARPNTLPASLDCAEIILSAELLADQVADSTVVAGLPLGQSPPLACKRRRRPRIATVAVMPMCLAASYTGRGVDRPGIRNTCHPVFSVATAQITIYTTALPQDLPVWAKRATQKPHQPSLAKNNLSKSAALQTDICGQSSLLCRGAQPSPHL